MDKFNTSLTELKSPARYAIFVGYKVDVNPEDYATPEELSLAIQSKMKDDIINNLIDPDLHIGDKPYLSEL